MHGHGVMYDAANHLLDKSCLLSDIPKRKLAAWGIQVCDTEARNRLQAGRHVALLILVLATQESTKLVPKCALT